MITTQSSLLVRLRSRDDSDAWSRFVRLYTPLIHHWVTRLGIESNRADDLVQEIFLILLDRASMLATNPPTSFRAWLRTVTLNKSRDWFRKQQQGTNPVILERIEQATADPTELLTDTEYRTWLAQSALQLMRDSFSETTWRACWEHVARSRPAKEVAEELGVTENAVYLARGRVLKRLREELEGLWE